MDESEDAAAETASDAAAGDPAPVPMRLEVGETVEIAAGGATVQVVGRESLEWYAGWGTLSLINAALAQGKNRSGLGWWLLSLLLGPVATLLLCLFDKLPEGVGPAELLEE